MLIDTYAMKNFVAPLIWRLFHGTRNMDIDSFASSIAVTLVRECDLMVETEAHEEIGRRISDDPFYSRIIKVPKVYRDFCTKKLITMELAKGLHPLDRLVEMDSDKLWDALMTKLPEYSDDYSVHLFRAMGSLWGDMILNWGVIHTDPQLGNIYLMEPQDGEGWRIFLCDFGNN